MSDSYSLLDLPGSVGYGLLETVGGLPGIRDTEFLDWLDTAPMFQGARNLRDQNPGLALGGDIAATFIPYIGWGTALNKARAGVGALGAINRAGIGAASLFRGNAPLAFAAGETVRYAPISAAITGFDTLGGRYDNPWDAVMGLGVGTALGGGFQALGHAAAPLVTKTAPRFIGEMWRSVFEPGPELSALYGFSNSQRAAASRTAAAPVVQEALAPENEPQIVARTLYDLIREAEAGKHPDIDVDLLRGQYDRGIRAVVAQRPNQTDQVFRFAADANDGRNVRGAIEDSLRYGASREGKRVRIPLEGTGDDVDNPDILTRILGLPEGWLHEVKWPGITQADRISTTYMRRELNLETSGAGKNMRQVTRVSPDGELQSWVLRKEEDTGLWYAATQIPGEHKMTGRARYDETKRMDKNEDAGAFLTFKTDRPGRFFPDAFADTDNADPDAFWFSWDNVPRGKSKFLDTVMDFNNVHLSPQTIKGVYKAWLEGPAQRENFVKSLLSGPTMGQQIAKVVETYAAPTIQQLKDSPEGRAVLGLYQATFEAAESRARRTLYGLAGIPENKSPMAALFSDVNVGDDAALISQLRKTVLSDPEALELIRRFDKNGDVPLNSILGTPAGKWLQLAIKGNLDDLTEINEGIKALQSVKATDSREIPIRQKHFGLSRRWDGSIFYPIYGEGGIRPVATVAGHSRAKAEQKALSWIEAAGKADGKKYRMGSPYIPGETDRPPNWLRSSALNPSLLEPRAGMRGYEHEYEPYKHVDELIAELEDNYLRRWRYAAGSIADALTVGRKNVLRANQPKSYNIVDTRIAQLKGQPGPFEERINQIVDSFAAPYLGTNSASKAADATNELMFHTLHGVGNIATPALNLTSLLQTQLPMGVEFLTSNVNALKGYGYQFPMFGADGMARPGFNWVADPLGLLWGAVREASNPSEESKEVFQYLWNKKVMGASLANEYTGQDRGIAARMSEGIRGPEDYAYWAKRLSSLFMSKTEQVSRTWAAGMALTAMRKMEETSGMKFTLAQKVRNAEIAVERSNYSYFKQDRPMMFTTPLGSLFGNQKTWMTNYLFMMAHYTGLAQKGNFAPLLFSLGTTTALGGVFAIPLLGMGIDAFTETFADQDGREFIYRNMGEAGNAVAFGAPALFGMSLAGNVAAPGSNLAHDTEFFFSIVALERAKLLGRAIGRAYDDQITLGMNPLKDEIFQRQAAQALAPRSLYRGWEALTSDQLTSAATGYPLVREMGFGARIMHGLGFRDVDVALQYEAYASLLADKNAMREKLALFGEAYANASLNNDRQRMTQLLQQAAVAGLDINDIMRSAQTRMRNAGADMFGRNFNQDQLEQYQASLRASGRG